MIFYYIRSYLYIYKRGPGVVVRVRNVAATVRYARSECRAATIAPECPQHLFARVYFIS